MRTENRRRAGGVEGEVNDPKKHFHSKTGRESNVTIEYPIIRMVLLLQHERIMPLKIKIYLHKSTLTTTSLQNE